MGDEHTLDNSREHSIDDIDQVEADGASAGGSSDTVASCTVVNSMAERERRNAYRGACSNAAQSKNQRQQESAEPARNRHRDKAEGSARNRSSIGTAASRTASCQQGAAGDAVDDDVVEMADPSLPCLTTSIRTSNFTGLSAEEIHLAVSTHNWQASNSTTKERLCFVFNNELMSDVHFIVGRDAQAQRIPAHKFVLSIGSAVFDAMFHGCMAVVDSDVELPDVEPAAFLSMLRFLYTDEVSISPDTVMHCLYTAKKYAVVALERACVEFLKRNLSSDNAFVLLTQARLFDEPQLAAMCLEMIDKMTNEALSADSFTDIDIDTLCMVLERDTLGIRESKLFSAVCRWAEAECARRQLPVTPDNLRLVLSSSRALELIRFPLMTVEEFAVGPAQSGLLTDREIVELFLHFTVTNSPKPTVRFSEVPRCCLTGREQVISRFCKIETRWGYSGTSDRIRFTVNRKIFVVGFGLFGSIHSAAEYGVNIQVLHTDTGHTCGSNDSTYLSDGSKSTFRVMFKEPIEIQANTSYTACAALKGPDSYYGTKGLRKVTHESMSSGKVTFVFTYAAGNNNGTSVEDGQLPEIIFYT